MCDYVYICIYLDVYVESKQTVQCTQLSTSLTLLLLDFEYLLLSLLLDFEYLLLSLLLDFEYLLFLLLDFEYLLLSLAGF